MSKESWAFISGGLIYIFAGVYFGFEFFKVKLKQLKFRNEEWLPLVNTKGEIIGKAPRSECHKNKELLHPVVHLHVFDQNNHLFLQKRPLNKLVQPGKWDTAVGGHIAFGEKLETALQREAEEEIGLKNFQADLLACYVWETEIERELVYLYVTQTRENLKINQNELEDGRFWGLNEIKENLEKNIFTPNFELEFKVLGDVMKKNKISEKQQPKRKN